MASGNPETLKLSHSALENFLNLKLKINTIFVIHFYKIFICIHELINEKDELVQEMINRFGLLVMLKNKIGS
jgi:hypothetical protein